MLTRTAAAFILGYQRYLSPYKGFCCAYRHQTGRASCSEYARRVVLRGGLAMLVKGLPRQFARCRAAYAAYLAARPARERGRSKKEDKKGKRDWRDYVDCNPCDCISLSPKRCGAGDCDVLPCDCSP